jgi:transcriptional regulator
MAYGIGGVSRPAHHSTIVCMYSPSQFEETRIETLHALIRAHPLGTLITFGEAGLEANHIPFEVHPDPAPFGTLRAHVARSNSVWRNFSADVGALVVFQGPSAYITPSWYATKRDTGKVVPTYNYAVVHASGPMRAIEDRVWLRALVGRLTDRFEAPRSEPWQVGDAPADFIDNLLGAIVGLEIPLARLVGKWKMSQNRPAADIASIVDGLLETQEADAAEVAKLVEARNRR